MIKYICTICGMIINEKNYNLNEEAFEDFNSVDNIKHCPFCGVRGIYLKELAQGEVQLLNNPVSLVDSNISKILDHAMKLEVFNGDFYQKASELVNTIEIKNMFKSLAKIEFNYARIHKSLGGFKELPILREMDYKKYDEENLIKLANKREKHAVEYYNKYSEEVSSSRLKEIFNALSKVEKEHINLTIK
ncbi:rubrerythrin [Clostridium tetanomorphum]|uniref:ferritin-like domain-containing protein n=1 Tax=Clostridium tetanomorphum TaxID=1553 RepID=UPI000449D4C0|nr:ferritin family protein [Clostridium tetanomorphum]KAJ51604.1 hypothetical protein CTM_12035 [Clostridium tetanomorphum DSM 665]MBP1863829.1 rubrerythrin [Clostridium tetanomorphum]NRS84907.1 rubrerythrin [Clostridium tetanomorphum]SQB91576.1 rubrerythrin [Clostridium tetanomorphum]